jgi:hypothetical protein
VKRAVTFLLVLILALAALPASAQESEETLQLSMQRDFGFSLGGRIQGRFTLAVTGPDGLEQVEFLIDDQVIGVDREPPYRLSLSTGDYKLGVHRISAVGSTVDGRQLRAAELTFQFIGADEGWRAAMGIVVPIIGGTVALMLVAALGMVFLGRRKGPPRIGEYGAAGGAVCARCELPFSRHVLFPNLLIGKLERCPHCGKWAIVRRATREALEMAEARLAAEEVRGGLEHESEEEKLRRQIEDSRFES